MQKVKSCGRNDTVRLELSRTSSTLAMEEDESAESRIERLLSESPVVIFARSSSTSSTGCMCHVMRNLLATIGVHPTVVQLDDEEMKALPGDEDGDPEDPVGAGGGGPAVFIGGRRVGGLERVVALHLSGQLVAKLVEVGAMKQGDAAAMYGVA
uniref:Glutaredoxin domain-containing protein n=1 Tax=Kalanchoe fedtschenkoi TaxID=63787 RepID=A0A7N0V7J6_KALFE